MGVNSTLYNLVLVLHLVAVVVGFGTVFLNGAYGAQAKRRPGPGGLAIGEATYAVTKTAEYAIYAVPVFGILLVVLSDDAWEFSQLWISLSFLLYFIGIGLFRGMLTPAARRLNALAGELVGAAPAGGGGRPPQVTEMEALEKRLAVGGTILNLIVVAVIALMVFKPGL
ncbi:MAG: DUF2269 family protein [Actinomycetota bacterium]|nr:DUF2269 family protein [Actinomycetota bacterium]